MDDIYKLWRSWVVVMEMLDIRGYDIPKENLLTTEEEFREWVGDDLSEAREIVKSFFVKKTLQDMMVCVFWVEQIGNEDVRLACQNLRDREASHAILVYNTKLTSYAVAAIRSLKIQKTNIETFSISELQYNVTKHVDVPRHIICSSAKKDEILKAYSISKEQIPYIRSADDAVAKFLGAKKGQMIKIVRPSEAFSPITTVDEKGVASTQILYDISYRIVV